MRLWKRRKPPLRADETRIYALERSLGIEPTQERPGPDDRPGAVVWYDPDTGAPRLRAWNGDPNRRRCISD